MIQEYEIKQAYKRLGVALLDANDLTEDAIKARATVNAVVAEAIFDGRIDGKNESAREAQARRLFAAEYERLDETEGWARQARHRVEMREQAEAGRGHE